MGAVAYDQDFYTWALEQAKLLRERKFDQVDLEHLVEEIEDMGKSEKRALESFFETLLMQLLKWQYQPAHQGWSWKYTIIEQRKRIERHLKENPGLRNKLPEILESAYEYAVSGAIRETGLAPEAFPETCPWGYEQFMARDFWPEAVEGT